MAGSFRLCRNLERLIARGFISCPSRVYPRNFTSHLSLISFRGPNAVYKFGCSSFVFCASSPTAFFLVFYEAEMQSGDEILWSRFIDGTSAVV